MITTIWAEGPAATVLHCATISLHIALPSPYTFAVYCGYIAPARLRSSPRNFPNTQNTIQNMLLRQKRLAITSENSHTSTIFSTSSDIKGLSLPLTQQDRSLTKHVLSVSRSIADDEVSAHKEANPDQHLVICCSIDSDEAIDGGVDGC